MTINDIVFRIGPKINAAGRVESGNKSVELLIADDETRATEVAASINNFNDQRKKLDHDITEEALEYIKEDEYVEVTPHHIRLRKIILDETERKRSNK